MKFRIHLFLALTGASPVFPQVLINEVLFNPAGTDAEKEKIEIRNAGSSAVDLSGYDLYPDGIGYFTFPAVVLQPGGIAVVHLRQTGVDSETDFYHSAPTSNMGNTSGSVALFTSTTHSAATVASFVQWGAGAQAWASAAATAGIWSGVGDFAPAIAEGHSLEYDGSGFTPGDWFDQEGPTLGTANALPVILAMFSVRVIPGGVLVSWETLSEIDNYGFAIERRPALQDDPASAWRQVGFVAGSGTTQIHRRYSFSDVDVAAGKHQYRLRQMDRSGGTTLSETAEVDVGRGPFLLECYPNPFNSSTQVRFAVPDEGELRLSILDIAGRRVRVLFSGRAEAGKTYSVVLRGEELASGMYFLSCEFRRERISRKILLLR